MTAPELAPCPWCQRDTLIIDERTHTALRETYAVRCKSNTCRFECEPFLNEKDAVALFRRASAPPPDPSHEAMVAALKRYGRHDPMCEAHPQQLIHKPCDCGLDAAIKAAQG